MGLSLHQIGRSVRATADLASPHQPGTGCRGSLGRRHRPHSRDLPQPYDFGDSGDTASEGDLRPRAGGGHPHNRGRGTRSGTPAARSQGSRCRYLCRKLSQVAVRTQGLSLPLCPPGTAGLGGVADYQLGLAPRPHLRHPEPATGNARCLGVSLGPGGHRFPGRTPLGGGPGSVPCDAARITPATPRAFRHDPGL